MLAIEDREQPQAAHWQIDQNVPCSSLTRDYAIIARLHDQTTEQMIVVAAGIGENGTIAAGQMLTNPQFFASGRGTTWNPAARNVEAVIETEVIDGKSGPPRIVAVTTWQAAGPDNSVVPLLRPWYTRRRNNGSILLHMSHRIGPSIAPPACLLTLLLATLSSSARAQTAQLPAPPAPEGTSLALLSAAREPLASSTTPFVAPTATSSSSAATIIATVPSEAPVELHADSLHSMIAAAEPPPSAAPNRMVRPFSAVAIGVKVGVAGIGVDLAIPLAQRFNFRVGGSLFQYSGSYNVDGTTINGEAKLRSVNMSVDWFPFNNRFRISPGIILDNGNNLNATASVPGGQTFDLNDATYTSSMTDPIHGTASLTFGKRTAPSITIGAGNMIPRHGSGHFSIPFEFGIEYISDPMLTLALQGTACTQGVCQNVATNPDFQANLQAENTDLNNDIHPLRFYPILSIGLAYKF